MRTAIIAEVICPTHQVQMTLRHSRFGAFYGCPAWPDCDIAIGCHPGTTTPLGTPADATTRRWRLQAHDVFDRLWRAQGAVMTRGEAYEWMQHELGLTSAQAHIGLFDGEQCERLIRRVQALRLRRWSGR